MAKLPYSDERRMGQGPVPGNLGRLLTDLQSAALSQLESFGWSLAFVRQSGLISPMIVVEGPASRGFAVLAQDGVLDQRSALSVR